MPTLVREPMDRFMAFVDKRADGCWIWTGARVGAQPHQYGSFRPGTRETDPKVPAHRWLYEQLVGPVPDDWHVDHLCKVKLCCNPEHLEAVTAQENHRRKRLTTCRSGLHDLTDTANVRWDNQGRRRGCAVCHRMAARTRHERQGSSHSV